MQSQQSMYNGSLCLSELQHEEPRSVHSISDISPGTQVGGCVGLHHRESRQPSTVNHCHHTACQHADTLGAISDSTASREHRRASGLTIIHSNLLLPKFPVQPVCDPDSSVVHVHTATNHRNHPYSVRSAQPSHPE